MKCLFNIFPGRFYILFPKKILLLIFEIIRVMMIDNLVSIGPLKR